MASKLRIHVVLLGDLEEHSVRECCQGAAEYFATRPGIDFDPWGTYPGRGARLTLGDLQRSDALLLSSASLKILGVRAGQIRRPRVFYLAPEEKAPESVVRLDEQAIGRMAAEHLIGRGYRHLAYFAPRDADWSGPRGEGFRTEAAAHGIRVLESAALRDTGSVYRSRRRRASTRLHLALQALPAPCGIFAGHDIAACYIVQAARDLGLRVPSQLAVVGADDDPIANAAAGLAVSTIRLPFREVGWQAAAMLDRKMQGKKTASPRPFAPIGVITRTSTHAFMTPDPLLRRAQALVEGCRGEARRPTVGGLVRELRTTEVTLAQRFRRHLRTTPAAYILQRRIEYAKELLREGRMNVEEVAEACAFHDSSSFGAVFKRVTGTSPGSWRPGRG
jgi:LacI family transcriptional regulator